MQELSLAPDYGRTCGDGFVLGNFRVPACIETKMIEGATSLVYALIIKSHATMRRYETGGNDARKPDFFCLTGEAVGWSVASAI